MNEKLAILKGCELKSEIAINSSLFSIGRCKTADFIIPHINVSRNHCQILRAHNLWKICDFSSSGTFINNKLIGKDKSAFLNDGDVIRLGPQESKLSWIFSLVETKPGNNKQFTELLNNNKSNTQSNDVNPKKSSKTRQEVIKGKSTISNYMVKEKEDCFKNEILKNTNKYGNLHNDTVICSLNENKTQSEKELENKLIKQEEEKEALLKKLKEMEEAQKKLFQKIDENEINKADLKNESMSNSDSTKTDDGVRNNTINKSQENKDAQENKSLEAKAVLDNVTDLMETELQCTICSELFVTAVTLACSHTFCQFCINQWKKKQKTCPICRKKITNEIKSLVVDNYIEKMVENLSSVLKERREAIIAERKETLPVKRSRRLRSLYGDVS